MAEESSNRTLAAALRRDLGREPGTGSARMETFRQGGESLTSRYHAWRLHPFSLRGLMGTHGVSAGQALARSRRSDLQAVTACQGKNRASGFERLTP